LGYRCTIWKLENSFIISPINIHNTGINIVIKRCSSTKKDDILCYCF